MLLWCFGPARRVYGVSRFFFEKHGVEDATSAVLEFESGAVASHTSVWHNILHRGSSRQMTVICENAQYSWAHDDYAARISCETNEAGARGEIAPEEVPGLIDELPAISALAARGGQVTIHGAGELRVKESDRITTLVTGFRNLGIEAEEHGDGYTIRGTGAPKGGVAHAEGDHRMAMAFAIAALSATGPSTIEGAEAVVISYPGFFDTLQRLVA